MVIQDFPDPSLADADGLLAVGGDLDVESLKLAYQRGIFPWPMDGLPLPWFSPPVRAVVEFSNLRINRSLRRALRTQNTFHYSLNQDFQGVIQHCASTKRPGQRGTWITQPMKAAYQKAHRAGLAHSVEVWQQKEQGKELVGGIYGVEVGGIFSAESMFYRAAYASKFALLALIETLKAQGATWMDIQMLTPHMEAIGATEIPRAEFLGKLKQTHARKLKLDWTPRALQCSFQCKFQCTLTFDSDLSTNRDSK